MEDVDILSGNEKQEMWLSYGEEGRVLLAFISADDSDKLYRKSVETSWDNKHQPTRELNSQKFAISLGSRVIKGWENLAINGEPLEFNSENRDLLMIKSHTFPLWVMDNCKKISNFLEKKQKKAEGATKKNLSNS